MPSPLRLALSPRQNTNRKYLDCTVSVNYSFIVLLSNLLCTLAVGLSVLTLINVKLHKTLAAKNTFVQEKLKTSLLFPRVLALIGFRTTESAPIPSALKRLAEQNYRYF